MPIVDLGKQGTLKRPILCVGVVNLTVLGKSGISLLSSTLVAASSVLVDAVTVSYYPVGAQKWFY